MSDLSLILLLLTGEIFSDNNNIIVIRCCFPLTHTYSHLCSFSPPHVKRKRQLEEMANRYKLPLTVAEFYTRLFTESDV